MHETATIAAGDHGGAGITVIVVRATRTPAPRGFEGAATGCACGRSWRQGREVVGRVTGKKVLRPQGRTRLRCLFQPSIKNEGRQPAASASRVDLRQGIAGNIRARRRLGKGGCTGNFRRRLIDAAGDNSLVPVSVSQSRTSKNVGGGGYEESGNQNHSHQMLSRGVSGEELSYSPHSSRSRDERQVALAPAGSGFLISALSAMSVR